MRRFILLFSLLLLAGCGNLEQLQILSPDASDFDGALAAEYLAYANAESEQGHTLVSEYFAAKGLRAWGGTAVEPEAVDTFLPRKTQAKLNYAREMLMAMLVDDVKRVAGQKAARAQLLFDCSVRQAAMKQKPPAACYDELQTTLAGLQMVASSFVLGKEMTHNIRFAAGSAAISSSARDMIREIADYAKEEVAYAIVLEGRVDSAKTKALFEKRVRMLHQAFAMVGISEEYFQTQSTDSGKEVYLSCDDTVKDRNIVRVTLRVFHADKPTGETKQ